MVDELGVSGYSVFEGNDNSAVSDHDLSGSVLQH